MTKMTAGASLSCFDKDVMQESAEVLMSWKSSSLTESMAELCGARNKGAGMKSCSLALSDVPT